MSETKPQGNSHRILVIDDEAATRYALSWSLREAGFKVSEAATGQEGMKLLSESPDLIVLDVFLPDISGFEICRLLKANPETASIPVLHMSAAYSTSAHKTHGLELGADAYLIHPVEARELLATVRALLRIRESEARAHVASKIWKSTFDAIQDGVCLIDDAGRILNGNRALLEIIPQWDSNTKIQELVPSLPQFHQSSKTDDVRIGERWYSYEVNPVETGGMVCTFRDVTERRSAEEELLMAKKAAESANLSKSMFLANMSHEIRTPLGAMLGFAGLIKDDGVSDEERIQYLDTIIRNGHNLSLLIDDILDLSKVEAEKMEFERVPVDIRALLNDVVTSLAVLASAKSVTIKSEWADSCPPVILSDASRVRQILTNIVGNAVKFTAIGSVIVRAKRIGNQICFEVEDSGRGISEEYIDNLFQPFSQGDSSTTRRFGGTGLGLVLSKQLAKGLGGDVALLQSRLGVGSTFCITVNAEQATIENKKATKVIPNGKHFEGLKILIADDSPDNRLLLRRILLRQGIEVADVENGLEAVERAHLYDIVLMDIQMPILDGYYATARLRAEGYDGPIIALTAHAMKEEKDRCLAIGCSEYLTKPIDVDLLLKSIARHSSRKSQVQVLH